MCVRIIGRDFRTRSILAFMFGLLWVTQGWMISFEPIIHDFDDGILFYYIPVQIRVFMWVITGIISMCTTFELIPEKWGWVALTVMPVERGISLFAAWIAWITPGAPIGLVDGLPRALFWLLIIIVIYFIAQMSDRY